MTPYRSGPGTRTAEVGQEATLTSCLRAALHRLAEGQRAAACLELSQSGMAHASEIISQLRQHKMLIREVPVQIAYTEYSLAKGQSSLNSINILLDLVIGRFLK